MVESRWEFAGDNLVDGITKVKAEPFALMGNTEVFYQHFGIINNYLKEFEQNIQMIPMISVQWLKWDLFFIPGKWSLCGRKTFLIQPFSIISNNWYVQLDTNFVLFFLLWCSLRKMDEAGILYGLYQRNRAKEPKV